MDDPADVGFVDAHAEGDRGADDARVVAEKHFLIAGAFLGGETGVIRAGEETAPGEGIGDALGRGTARAVDDTALVFALADEIDDLFRGFVFGDDAVSEIRAVEAGDKRLRVAELQVSDDVFAHAARGGGGECHHGHVG